LVIDLKKEHLKMKIVEREIELNMSDEIRQMPVSKKHPIEFSPEKAQVIRNTVSRLKKENSKLKFRTQTGKGKKEVNDKKGFIYVYKLSE
jgi:hypothetical protein